VDKLTEFDSGVELYSTTTRRPVAIIIRKGDRNGTWMGHEFQERRTLAGGQSDSATAPMNAGIGGQNGGDNSGVDGRKAWGV
jgi:hypothetical protein